MTIGRTDLDSIASMREMCEARKPGTTYLNDICVTGLIINRVSGYWLRIRRWK